MKKLTMSIILILSLLNAVSVYATGLYSKPEFRGRVIDTETKQPIEGAVVVVLYYKINLIGGPGGPRVYITAAKETLTTKNGEFYIPSYSAIMLFSKDLPTHFIFYKPGYMATVGIGLVGVGIALEEYFATDVIGKEAEIHNKEGIPAIYKGPLGIMELKKAKTIEDRRKTRPSSGGLEASQLPIFFRILEEEYNYLYN